LIAVGPITYYLSNPQKIWFIGSKINLTTSKSFFYQKPPREKIISHNLFAVENLHNCFMVKKEIGEKVSWFDEKMIISGTEIDMFLRIKKINPDYFLAINLDARCYHDILTPKENLIRNLGFNRPKRAYFFQRNRAILISKHGNLLQKLLFGLLFYPFFLLAYGLLFIIKKRFDLLYNHLKATGVGYYYLFKGF